MCIDSQEHSPSVPHLVYALQLTKQFFVNLLSFVSVHL